MPRPARKPESPHRLSIKLGTWFEAHSSGFGVVALLLVAAGFGAGRAVGFW